jgi:elongation factor G
MVGRREAELTRVQRGAGTGIRVSSATVAGRNEKPGVYMMSRRIEDIRNIGIIAHIDAGKTTVTEDMLFCAGFTHRLGEVDKGTAETDFDEEEQQRGITIFSACVTFQWKKSSINLIDTPGHVDFTAEVERSLRVLDGGVVVFSAREGVEAQSLTVWRQADRYGVPRIAFINKMDREGAEFQRTVDEIRDRLEAHPVPIQMPVGQGPPHIANAFRGIIDLIEMKMLTFADQGRQVMVQEIPPDSLDEAILRRHELLDALANLSDPLMELMLEEKEVPTALVYSVLRTATIERQVQPVLCGSALARIGIPPLMDAVSLYLPSPLDMPPVKGTTIKKRKETDEQRKPSPDEPFCGLVFKVLPAKTGDLSWVRVYSGELKANTRVLNPGKDKKENVAQLWRILASRREQIELVSTGDIAGIIGLRNSITGDTLCDTQHPILLESIAFPDTVISMAIEPETTTDRKKLTEPLELMKRQDPTFRASENPETGQTLISGMGELHLEVIKKRLLRDYNLNVKVHKPRVTYRETIAQPVVVTGECHRQVAGQQLFARLKVKLEPKPGSQAVSIASLYASDLVPRAMMDAALEELRARAEGGGVIGGFPLVKMKISILEAEHSEASTEVAFRIAAGDAFESALRDAGPVLLEPIMKLDITTPEEHTGDFVGDIQQRRGIIARTESRGKSTFIEAHAPLSELFGYSSAMHSLSHGCASYTMEPLEYAPAPESVMKSFQLY